ncbi:hypothetical protein CONLIGDRAFT_648993 [Coniochaeta ligniaria NRRL 30616]|uniref:Uncharacterized protein n=1 Tax=Coniochaeta ligniaria NRRL 30616 TaxID=1408157 RepID=A0A1J7J325_9PEZI|nr:hypothetical protein CONLIGDRAFT_648993 [Coniochaeta ligniaria NRRL 30616]
MDRITLVQATLVVIIVFLAQPLLQHLETTPPHCPAPSPSPGSTTPPPRPSSGSDPVIYLDIGFQTISQLETYTHLLNSSAWRLVTGSPPANASGTGLGPFRTDEDTASPLPWWLKRRRQSSYLPEHWFTATADLLSGLESLITPALAPSLLATMTTSCGGFFIRAFSDMPDVLWDWECIRDKVLPLSNPDEESSSSHNHHPDNNNNNNNRERESSTGTDTLHRATSLALALLEVARAADTAYTQIYFVEGFTVDLAEELIRSGFAIGKIFADYADMLERGGGEDEEGGRRIEAPGYTAGSREWKPRKMTTGSGAKQVAYWAQWYWPTPVRSTMVERAMGAAGRALKETGEAQGRMEARLGDFLLGFRAAVAHDDGRGAWERVMGGRLWKGSRRREMDALVRRVEGLLEKTRGYALAAEQMGPVLDGLLRVHRRGMAVQFRESERLGEVVRGMMRGGGEGRRVVLAYREAMWPRGTGRNVSAATRRLVDVAQRAWVVHGGWLP